MASALMAGCGSSQTTAAETTTVSESDTQTAASEEHAAPDAGENGQKGDRGPQGQNENGENHTGGARVGDRGGMNQKVVLTDAQQELIDATKGKFEQDSYQDDENGVSLDYALYVPAKIWAQPVADVLSLVLAAVLYFRKIGSMVRSRIEICPTKNPV